MALHGKKLRNSFFQAAPVLGSEKKKKRKRFSKKRIFSAPTFTMQEEEQQQEQQQQGQEQEQQQQQPLKPRNRPLPTLPSWKPSRLPIKSPSTAFQLSSDTTGSTTLASSSSSTTLVPTPPSPLSSAPSVSSTPIQNEFNERASIKKSPSPNNVYTAAELNRIEDIFACLEDLNDSSSSGSEDSEELIQYLKELRSLTSTYRK